MGTGTQARYQIKALSKVRDFSELRVWGRTRARVDAYVADMAKVLEAEVVPFESAEKAVRGSDVVVTATVSRSPIVKASWLSKGVHVTAMGSDSPEKQELEADVLRLADKYVCDSVRQCAELGELHHALKAGSMTEADVHAELGEILLGTKSGREREDEITVCDLTGIAVQDVVSAQLVYERALRESIGSYLEV
jgi:ornithine cyclodeaminase/alanine dehydrogenase-like protein (mu-crystallin family)